MRKIKKGLAIRVISLIILTIFLSSDIVYSSGTFHLRVPMNIIRERRDEALGEISRIDAVGLARQLNEKGERLLTKKEEQTLFSRYKSTKDPEEKADIFECLMQCNQGLVSSVAGKNEGRGLDRDDMISEGNIGLITAIEKFDETKGFKFSTYGTW